MTENKYIKLQTIEVSANEWIRRLDENTNGFDNAILRHKMGQMDKQALETQLCSLQVEQKEILKQLCDCHPKTVQKAFHELSESDKKETFKTMPFLLNTTTQNEQAN